jgi:hypothetical protein
VAVQAQPARLEARAGSWVALAFLESLALARGLSKKVWWAVLTLCQKVRQMSEESGCSSKEVEHRSGCLSGHGPFPSLAWPARVEVVTGFRAVTHLMGK